MEEDRTWRRLRKEWVAGEAGRNEVGRWDNGTMGVDVDVRLMCGWVRPERRRKEGRWCRDN